MAGRPRRDRPCVRRIRDIERLLAAYSAGMPGSLGGGRSACRTPSCPRPAPAAAARTRAAGSRCRHDRSHRLIPRAAGVATIAVSDDLDHVRVSIQATRPGVVLGHGGAELDRLRAELQELTGKPVRLNMVTYDGPPKGRKEVKIGPELPAD